jgi:hypothetical protein
MIQERDEFIILRIVSNQSLFLTSVKYNCKTLMMKKLRIFCSLIFLPLFSQAQSFPVPGATWIFRYDYINYCDAQAEKYEYTGDSIVADGVIKKMKVTNKTINPHWFASDTTTVSVSYRYFLYSGDTIRNGPTVSDDLICNFSLTIGDSMYTPYCNQQNINLLNINTNCDITADSLIVFEKGVVSAFGTFTNDGVTGRYYTLDYPFQGGGTMQTTFSERSLINEGYWRRQLDQLCGWRIEGGPPYLVCYFDDSTADMSICSWDSWFAHLDLFSAELTNIELYPNPATDILTVRSDSPEPIEARISDLNGKLIREQFQLNSETTIDLSGFESGIYVLNLQAKDGTVHKKFVVE